MRKEQLVSEPPDAHREMTAAQAGDSDAYERLLTSLLPELGDFLGARLRDHPAASDVVQKVLLSIHHSCHTRAQPERRLSPLLRAIAGGDLPPGWRTHNEPR